MRKVLGIIFYVIAGFFVYAVSLLTFVEAPPGAMWSVLGIFTVLAVAFHIFGLAINRYNNWRRHSGIVLVSGVGAACFVLFVFVCLLMTDEYRRLIRPETRDLFSAYSSGVTFVILIGALGILLLRQRLDKSNETDATNADSPSA